MSKTSGPTLPDSSGRLVDLFEPSRVIVTDRLAGALMRGVLILGAAARHRPTDAYRPPARWFRTKLWRYASGRNLRTRSKATCQENSLRNRPETGLQAGRMALISQRDVRSTRDSRQPG